MLNDRLGLAAFSSVASLVLWTKYVGHFLSNVNIITVIMKSVLAFYLFATASSFISLLYSLV